MESNSAMDSEALQREGKKMIDFVANHWKTLKNRRPQPGVQPGYIKDLVPSEPPQNPEEWDKIFKDLENVVMKGNTNWHHPHFFAYFPTACSYPGVVGEILSAGIAATGFTWKSCPSMTELEQTTLDWLVHALNLPEHFKHSHDGPGCGIIQATASDSTLMAVQAARARAVEKYKADREKEEANNVEEDDGLITPYYHDAEVFCKFVAYCSDQAHCSVEKAFMLCGVKLRKLKSTREPKLGNYSITAETLQKAIETDRARGLVPFVLIATMGTTNTNAVDFIKDLGPICNREGIWLHVDAAYAGSFLLCPEYRYMSEGMEMVDSFNFNAHKSLLVNFDCAPLWFKDGAQAAKYFEVGALYLKGPPGATDYRHLQSAFGRRFRSLKLWFVMRSFGVKYIQEVLRADRKKAELFASFIESDENFELFVPVHLGLVCFKLSKGDNSANQELLNAIDKDGRIHLMPAIVHNTLVIRLSLSTPNTTEEDVKFAFRVIQELAKPIIEKL